MYFCLFLSSLLFPIIFLLYLLSPRVFRAMKCVASSYFPLERKYWWVDADSPAGDAMGLGPKRG